MDRVREESAGCVQPFHPGLLCRAGRCASCRGTLHGACHADGPTRDADIRSGRRALPGGGRRARTGVDHGGPAGKFPLARDRSAPVTDHRDSARDAPAPRASHAAGWACSSGQIPGPIVPAATYGVCGMRDDSCRIRIGRAPPDRSAHGLGFARNKPHAKQGFHATGSCRTSTGESKMSGLLGEGLLAPSGVRLFGRDYTGLTIADLGLNPTSNDPLVTAAEQCQAGEAATTDWHGSTASATLAIISNWPARS